MTVIDERGRLFGRLNLVDAAVLAFLIALIPIGYGTYLMFQPARPRIDSVATTELNKEELRIASGTTIGAKLKVRGTGFNPLLRARVGDLDALSFVFENPNSADILIGEMPAGSYDLSLLDGVQVVARAAGAVTIKPAAAAVLTAVGRLSITDEQAATLKPGFRSAEGVRGGFEVVAVGAPRPSYHRIRFGNSGIDIASGNTERPAVLRVRCDQLGTDCSIGGISLGQAPTAVTLTGDVPFLIEELLPAAEPRRARVVVRFTGPHVALMKTGDRDELLDARAAVVREIGARDGNSATVTLELGADASSTGWSYRGQRLRPGATIRLITDRYEADGVIGRTDVSAAPQP
jgi:hypothetical protein